MVDIGTNEKSFSKACVMGLGYIGLPTASLLATRRVEVLGVDVNPKTVECINNGLIHIHEPDLDIMVRTAVQSGQLKASLEPVPADVFILAVPTPFCENHAPDYSYIEAATRMIAPYIAPGNLVVLESTSPVGTTEKVGEWLRELRPDLKIPLRGEDGKYASGQIYIAHCPERVLPGHVLRELVENDRVIGGIDTVSAEVARDFYERFVTGRILLTDTRTAELCKLAENSFRDVNIAFANELSLICEQLDINVWELIELTNCHPRVNILQPGPGVGGHCIAVDPWFIVHSAPEASRLIHTARLINDEKPERVVERVRQKAASFKNPVIACLGLAFKADIDDLRESPAMHIVQRIAEENFGQVLAVEPYVKELPASLRHLPIALTDVTAALNRADVIVLLVNHRQFSRIPRRILQEKVVIDTRGLWR